MERTILIADDEYSARKMLRMHLERLGGYTVVAEAANGQKALELFRSLSPDILITDIQMPIMNGLDLVEAIRREKENQIVIILSCYESFLYAQRAIRLGVRDYLVKDLITTEDLGVCLANAVADLPPKAESYAPKVQDVANTRGILPEHAAEIEGKLQTLSNSFFTRDCPGTLRAIQELYQTHFSGMTQFCFLQKVNNVVISWILNECVHHGISAQTILSGTESPLSMLASVTDPAVACSLLCRWTEKLLGQIAGENKESQRIRQIIAYLNENYHQDLSLQSVADHFHIHKVYLSRSFKEETGTNLSSYVSYLRIEKAKLLLCMKTYRTNEIAYMVGFHNTQNFYNVFRKLVGCAPSDYMEDNQRRSPASPGTGDA